MKVWLQILGGILLVILGLAWMLQGLDYVKGSAMTGVVLWAVIGPVVAILGIFLIIVGGRGLTRRDQS